LGSKLTKAAEVAGIGGALAAVLALAVFFIPTQDGREEAARYRSPGTAQTTQNSTSTPNPSGTIATNERRLAELPLTQGGGVVKVIDGTNLSMPCGSGQSDDQFRQIEFELPGPYASFTTQVTAAGKADKETSVGVQVFVRARQERSDRTLEAARVVLAPKGSDPLTADITNARALLLRITCSVSTLSVTFTDPRIGR
jgi:hypothetical protein